MPVATSFADLPNALHDAVASAGYRLARWRAAREVLEHRVTKKKLPGMLQAFLETWMPALEATAESLEVRFEGREEEFWLIEGGLAGLAAERALLHLPALRTFWEQELRRAHFEALRSMLPQAWFADEAVIPPGAVIAGIGTADWAKVPGLMGGEKMFLRVPEAAWSAKAVYHRDSSGRIVLRDWQALP